MKKLVLAAVFAAAFSLLAAAPPSGSTRLRELVVLPELNITFDFGLDCRSGEWVISGETDSSAEISRLRDELKHQPDDDEALLLFLSSNRDISLKE